MKLSTRVIMILVLVVSVLAGLLAPRVLAQEPVEPIDPEQVQALPDFLELLAGPVGWVLLGALVSMALARWSWYNVQPHEIKTVLPILIAALLSIGARLLLVYVPVQVWEVLEPYWFIIAGTVMTWLGSQGWYQLAVRSVEVELVREQGGGNHRNLRLRHQ